MSQTTEFNNFLKGLPAATNVSAMSLIAFDSNGKPYKASIDLLTAAIAATGKMVEVVTLEVNTDMDANNLNTSGCTIYRSSGDMRTHTAAYENFPLKPEGGFSLIVIKEGGWRRQIFMSYNSHNIYDRISYYTASGTKWKDWKQIAAS